MPYRKHHRTAGEPARGSQEEADALPGLYLLPGQLVVSPTPCAVRTILGSCVAVCLWDSTLQIGGMSHFVLPLQPAAQSVTESGRFGNVAIPTLIERLVELGSKRRNLSAKMFGGASIFAKSTAPDRGSHHSVGTKNIEIAHRLLNEARIPVAATDLGGFRGRKVIFHVHDGAAWVRKV